jgi:hypothetical protein
MSEAKPQNGSTVKGYRTLTPDDIEMMNEVKAVSREFLKSWISSNLCMKANQSQTLKLCAAWQSRAPKCRKPVCGHAAPWRVLTLIANLYRHEGSTKSQLPER